MSVDPELADLPSTSLHEHAQPQHEKTREQEELEEALGLLVMLGLIKAAKWARPRLQRVWSEHILTFLVVKRDQWRERKGWRQLSGQVTSEGLTTIARAAPVDEANTVGNALKAYEATMTSAEARRHFAEALTVQRFVNVKMRLLDQARSEAGGLPPEWAVAINELTPKQVENALDSLLASKPALLEGLGEFLKTNRDGNQLHLSNEEIHSALRITSEDVSEKQECSKRGNTKTQEHTSQPDEIALKIIP